METGEADTNTMNQSFSYLGHPAFQVFTVIGLLYISTKILSFVKLLSSIFLISGTSLSKFGPKGSWAVITGASDGIGKEFALQLAKRGFNIALISRTQSKLDALSTNLQSHYNVETKILAMDFAANRDKDYYYLEKLAKEVDGKGGIAILVNNVGLSHDIPVPFLETEMQEMRNIVTINCTATLRVTQTVAPLLVARKCGLIITMASFGGLLPTPLLATYSGSKAFLAQWSAALGAELAPKGVTVQCVQSYLVTSAMSKIRRPTSLIPTAHAFVRSALDCIGNARGSQGKAYTSTPYWSHALMQWGLESFVGTTSMFVIEQNRKIHQSIRRRALRKRERETKSQ